MSVQITSYVDAQAGGNDKIYLQVPSGVGSISITDVIGLQGALDTKLNDTLGIVGTANVTATGNDLNSIAGLTATGSSFRFVLLYLFLSLKYRHYFQLYYFLL